MKCTKRDDIIIESIGNKGVITLNRPNSQNAINYEMATKMRIALTQWELEKTLVILKGSESNIFCAGGDLLNVVEDSKDGFPKTGQHLNQFYLICYKISKYRIPCIAIISGVVMGFGLGMSMTAKYRIATEKSIFSAPEIAVGIFPDAGASYFLPRMDGKLGFYLGLTGHNLKGSDLLKAGIATHYINSKNLEDLERNLLTSNNSFDIEGLLEKFSASIDSEFSLAPHMNQINYCFDGATMEEVCHRLEMDGTQWAKKTLKTLRRISPKSLKVTLRQFRMSPKMNLIDCLKMEYLIMVNSFEFKYDFIEGMRAMFLDRDFKPKWKPDRIEDVTDEYVDEFFRPLDLHKQFKSKM